MTKSVFLTFIISAFIAIAGIHGFAQITRKSVSAAEVNGTFRMNFTGKFKDNSNDIKILALGGGKLHIAMDLVYPYRLQNREMMANMGQLDGEALITGDTAVYDSSEFGPCKITIKFVKPGTIKVSQEGTDGECGFGHNVNSDGTYRRVSSRKPKFDTSN
ncbi:MAG: hypothetical protein ABIP78_13605 [Pyrinomonadaceae bacterium]